MDRQTEFTIYFSVRASWLDVNSLETVNETLNLFSQNTHTHILNNQDPVPFKDYSSLLIPNMPSQTVSASHLQKANGFNSCEWR